MVNGVLGPKDLCHSSFGKTSEMGYLFPLDITFLEFKANCFMKITIHKVQKSSLKSVKTEAV